MSTGHFLRVGTALQVGRWSLLAMPACYPCHKPVEVARRYMRSADLWNNNVTEKVPCRG